MFPWVVSFFVQSSFLYSYVFFPALSLSFFPALLLPQDFVSSLRYIIVFPNKNDVAFHSFLIKTDYCSFFFPCLIDYRLWNLFYLSLLIQSKSTFRVFRIVFQNDGSLLFVFGVLSTAVVMYILRGLIQDLISGSWLKQQEWK